MPKSDTTPPEVLAALREHREQMARDPWAANETERRRRLRANGRRSLGENLSEGLDMIESLSSLVGAASKSR